MSEIITIGISDMKISENPDVFVTYALGSCVGICLYDPALRVGGMAHIMLPKNPENAQNGQFMRYADSCLPRMISQMQQKGCLRSRIVAKIAGGAKMFEIEGNSTFGNIGQRNVAAVKETLAQNRIPILAEDTGSNYGRTIYFHTENGALVVKSFVQGTRTI